MTPRVWFAAGFSLAAAAGLAFVNPLWAAAPLALFVLTCLAAPFFPRVSFYLPVITRGKPGKNAVAITFDDGPSEETTPRLLDLLAGRKVTATFFVVGQQAEQHPDLLRAIADAGHGFGNHSHTHDPLLMLRRKNTIAAQIDGCSRVLGKADIYTPYFRPPVGITGPRLGGLLAKRGMRCVNFACRGNDWGNRKVSGLSGRILGKVRPGDIVLLHDCPPGSGIAIEEWLGEVEAVLGGLKERNLAVVGLAELLGGRPGAVDERADPV